MISETGGEALLELRQNLFLVFHDRDQGPLILQDRGLVFLDDLLIRPDRFLVGEDRFLVLQDPLLVCNYINLRHCSVSSSANWIPVLRTRLLEIPKASESSAFAILASIVFSQGDEKRDPRIGTCELGASMNILLMVQQGCGSIPRRGRPCIRLPNIA